MYENFGLFIDGDWRTKGGHGTLGVVDPATGETIGTVPAADEGDVEEAIAAAEAGFGRWRSTPAWTRAAVSRIESGMIGVNSFALAAAEAPFGGTRSSGMGREGGSEGIRDYLNVKLSQVTV